MKFVSKIDKLLNELEKLHDIGRFPNINRKTGELMYNLIVRNNLKNIFEFGACNGYSTLWLALAAKKINGKVVTTEWGKNKFKWLIENIEKSDLSKYINALNKDARDALKENRKIYDFVFMDGMAKIYLEVFKLVELNLSDNAIIVADNIISHKEKLQDFIDYVKMNPRYISEIVDQEKGVMIIRKC